MSTNQRSRQGKLTNLVSKDFIAGLGLLIEPTIPMILQNAKTAFYGIIFAMVRGIISKRNGYT